MKYICLLSIFFVLSETKAQNNLIPNPGFEDAKPGKMPQCNYSYTLSPKDIEEDIQYWSNGKKTYASTNNNYRNSAPDWHLKGLGCTILPFGTSRHIYMEEYGATGQDAIITSLFSKMQVNKNYLFKIIYATGQRENNNICANGAQPNPMGVCNIVSAKITIWFTKFGKHWSQSWGNTKLWFDMYPPIASTGWVQHWHLLNGPLINSHPFFNNVFNKLNNIVLDCADEHVYIDYVELAENCANNLLIENHEFSPFANEIPYKSSNLIKAGYNVGNPSANGNVVVKSGATATFKAGLQIYLEPGFIAEPNSNFKTVIEPCNSNTARTIEDTIEIIDEKTIKIGDTYIYDDSQETLACNDTLVINGLDGDTTSFVNYFWDFGNGQTSDNPVATVYYTDPGEYLVQLILTDSSGVVDTLSKLYIVPDCNRIGGTSSNNIAGLNIYPNPNNGQFIIDIEDVNINNFVEIYDLTGRLIWQKIVLETKTTIDIANQPKGIYLVKVITGTKVYTQKLVYQ